MQLTVNVQTNKLYWCKTYTQLQTFTFSKISFKVTADTQDFTVEFF